MKYFALLIIITILVVIGGALYLLYLPLKIRLLRSGRLSKKLSSKITGTFLGFLCIAGIVMYGFKDYRKPSKRRIEDVADVHLPAGYRVIKDEYQDMWQDYAILYDIQLQHTSAAELITAIRASKFYNPDAFHEEYWKENDFIMVDSTKAVWARSPQGYDFSVSDVTSRNNVDIMFDTVTNILKYSEMGD